MNKIILIAIIFFSGCTNKVQYTYKSKYKTKVSSGCETEVTKIFTSKASGKIVTCQGKLLEYGQKTRIVRINK